MKFNERQRVIVDTDKHPVLKKGDTGTIVHVYQTRKDTYEVEFVYGRFKDNNKTFPLKSSEIIPK